MLIFHFRAEICIENFYHVFDFHLHFENVDLHYAEFPLQNRDFQ